MSPALEIAVTWKEFLRLVRPSKAWPTGWQYHKALIREVFLPEVADRIEHAVHSGVTVMLKPQNDVPAPDARVVERPMELGTVRRSLGREA